jgi:hypothetical protein
VLYPERLLERSDLVRRLCHALDISLRVVRRLAANGYTDRADPAASVRPEKAITETAFLLLAAAECAEPEVARRVQAVAESLLPYARSDRMRMGVCLEPALALDYAEAHACLTRLGYRDHRFDSLIDEALRSQARGGRERAPHRELEQWWIGELLGKSDHRRTSKHRSVLGRSALGQPLDLLNASREDIYAFTHTLMYALDSHTSRCRLPRSCSELLVETEVLLARCLDEEDYDLGGELLLAWPLTRAAWTVPAVFAWNVLARVEDEAGFLPSPGTRLKRLGDLKGAERTDYLLATAYHTVYVMGLLCAACLQPGRIPPARLPISRTKRSTSSHILSWLDRDSRKPHWRGELDKLSVLERDALGGFLLNIALRRCVAARDFGSLHELLAWACEAGLANAPGASQAAEMLQRLSILNETKTAHKPSGRRARSPSARRVPRDLPASTITRVAR